MWPCPSVLWQLAERGLWVTDTSKDEEGPQMTPALPGRAAVMKWPLTMDSCSGQSWGLHERMAWDSLG